MSNVRITNIGGTEAELAAEDKTYLLGEIVIAEKENGRLDMKLCDGKTKYSELSFLFDMIYPVGSIYMSVTNVDPNVLFGGTWVQIEDTFLLAAGSTYVAGTTGGEAEHVLSTNEMPSHTHAPTTAAPGTDVYNQYAFTINRHFSSGSVARSKVAKGSDLLAMTANTSAADYGGTEDISQSLTTAPTGGGVAHNNMPPYTTVYVWQRTA